MILFYFMFRKKAEKRKDVIKMAKELNLQDVFLNQARKEKIPVTIYITNGFQFKGLVRGFDNYTVILDTDGKQKHDQGIDQQYDCQPSPQNTGRSQFGESTRVRNEIAIGSAGSKFRRILSTALTGHLFLLSENLKNPLRRDAILQKKITSDTNFPNCERDPAPVTEIESEPAVFGIPGQQIMEFCEFARRMTDLCNPIFQ